MYRHRYSDVCWSYPQHMYTPGENDWHLTASKQYISLYNAIMIIESSVMSIQCTSYMMMSSTSKIHLCSVGHTIDPSKMSLMLDLQHHHRLLNLRSHHRVHPTGFYVVTGPFSSTSIALSLGLEVIQLELYPDTDQRLILGSQLYRVSGRVNLSASVNIWATNTTRSLMVIQHSKYWSCKYQQHLKMNNLYWHKKHYLHYNYMYLVACNPKCIDLQLP